MNKEQKEDLLELSKILFPIGTSFNNNNNISKVPVNKILVVKGNHRFSTDNTIIVDIDDYLLGSNYTIYKDGKWAVKTLDIDKLNKARDIINS